MRQRLSAYRLQPHLLHLRIISVLPSKCRLVWAEPSPQLSSCSARRRGPHSSATRKVYLPGTQRTPTCVPRASQHLWGTAARRSPRRWSDLKRQAELRESQHGIGLGQRNLHRLYAQQHDMNSACFSFPQETKYKITSG